MNLASSAASRVSTWQRLLSASSFAGALSNNFSDRGDDGDDEDEVIKVEIRCPKNLRIETEHCQSPWWARGNIGCPAEWGCTGSGCTGSVTKSCTYTPTQQQVSCPATALCKYRFDAD